MTALARTLAPGEIVERLRHDFHLPQSLIAESTGASVRSVRNWEQSGSVKPRYQQRLADLRDIVLVLEDSLSPRGIGQWLKARHRVLGGRTAYEALAAGDYETVRDAAEAYASGTYV